MMKGTVKKPGTNFTGVLPAEPGWRVLFANSAGRKRMAPVVGWAWERHVPNGEGEHLFMEQIHFTHGVPLVVWFEGHYLATTSEVVGSEIGDAKWHVETLLEPNARVGDRVAGYRAEAHPNGWVDYYPPHGSDNQITPTGRPASGASGACGIY